MKTRRRDWSWPLIKDRHGKNVAQTLLLNFFACVPGSMYIRGLFEVYNIELSIVLEYLCCNLFNFCEGFLVLKLLVVKQFMVLKIWNYFLGLISLMFYRLSRKRCIFVVYCNIESINKPHLKKLLLVTFSSFFCRVHPYFSFLKTF